MRIFMALLMMVMPAFVAAQDTSVLSRPESVLLMRHALAPGTGDPAGFKMGDCATQRNLSGAGRDQARRIGAALREADIRPTHIFTSEWCRCAETAHLLQLGDVTPLPALNSHFAGRGDAEAQGRAVLDTIADLPADARPLLVTHQVNITALTGVFPKSGEIIVALPSKNGRMNVTGRFAIDP